MNQQAPRPGFPTSLVNMVGALSRGPSAPKS